MLHALTSALILSVLKQTLSQQCGGPCHCPLPVSSCPPGVALLWDRCHCCQVCARQEGQPCSEHHVCDTLKGLQCDYSASYPEGPGECISQNLLDCELNGRRYHEGQSFQPSCAQQCKCSGGGITCVPLCPDDLQLPSATCLHPRMVKLPGSCCPQWVCDVLDNRIAPDTPTGLLVDRGRRSWLETSGQSPGLGSNCVDQASEWSPCSHSCGPGLSSRTTNRNRRCRPQTQTRFCQIRPCYTASLPLTQTAHGSCENVFRSRLPVRLEHRGCRSTRSFRPRYCGQCPDGRCCTPHHTRTVHLRLHCPRGGAIHQAVMLIESCTCHISCPASPLATPWGTLWGAY
ncbi:CCN family member 5-like [Alosa sapidissima]|uniref:CCN family member 5-like n=1 Tax=Alosa sapidissima TaxID=34773 RepID=UPI001C07F460|nr:CCN family member 5-like [Alosa sapidissima]XP_041945750.1 CCN family member 5-like [Alosa sapidissima]XP_041945751.1 CCN family member 5-like [Alosa sapidissima]